MIKIAVCDDEELVRQKLTKILRKIFEKEQILCDICEFSSGLELLEHAKEIQLLFLDMDMPGLDGIDVGIKISELNPWCQIVIASGREDRFKETYKVKPLGFISKPFEEDEIREIVQSYDVASFGREIIEVFRDRQSYQIQQKEIQYIAAFNGYVEMFVDGELYRKNISLNQLEKILVKDIFYKVHKSYIVNLFWVKEIYEKEVLVGNIKIPLSRRQGKDINCAYLKFDVKYR